jgi:hypothetical protein
MVLLCEHLFYISLNNWYFNRDDKTLIGYIGNVIKALSVNVLLNSVLYGNSPQIVIV